MTITYALIQIVEKTATDKARIVTKARVTKLLMGYQSYRQCSVIVVSFVVEVGFVARLEAFYRSTLWRQQWSYCPSFILISSLHTLRSLDILTACRCIYALHLFLCGAWLVRQWLGVWRTGGRPIERILNDMGVQSFGLRQLVVSRLYTRFSWAR